MFGVSGDRVRNEAEVNVGLTTMDDDMYEGSEEVIE